MKTSEYRALLENIAEAASSSAVAEEEGTDTDADWWEKQKELRISAAIDIFSNQHDALQNLLEQIEQVDGTAELSTDRAEFALNGKT